MVNAKYTSSNSLSKKKKITKTFKIQRCSKALDETNIPVRTLLVSEGHRSRARIPGTLAL